MGRGTAWLHGSCLASPHQHRGTGRNADTPSSGLWPGASLVEDSCIHGDAWGILCPSGAACPTIEVQPRAGGLPWCSHRHQALLAPALPARHRPWWSPQGCGAHRQCLAPACCGLCTATMVLPARPALSLVWEPSLCQPRSAAPRGPPHSPMYSVAVAAGCSCVHRARIPTSKMLVAFMVLPEDADGWRGSAGVYICVGLGRGCHTHNLWVLNLSVRSAAVPEAAAALRRAIT